MTLDFLLKKDLFDRVQHLHHGPNDDGLGPSRANIIDTQSPGPDGSLNSHDNEAYPSAETTRVSLGVVTLDRQHPVAL
jgi:hypothetical protein